MSKEKEQEHLMLQKDFKESQRRENYRRAEAFLIWKFGPMYDEARRFLKGSKMDWPSLFVEFVEKVEEDLLARMRHYDKAYWDNLQAKAMFGPFNPETPDLSFLRSSKLRDEDKKAEAKDGTT